MNKAVPTLMLLFALTGCSQWETIREATFGDADEGTTTLERVRRTIAVGDVLTANRPLQIAQTLHLDEALLASAEHRGTMMLVRPQPGDYRLVAEKSGARYFAAPAAFPTRRGDESLPGYGGVIVTEGVPVAAYWLWTPVRNPALAYTAQIVGAPVLKDALSQTIAADSRPGTATLRYAGVREDELLFVYDEMREGGGAGAEIALRCKSGQTCSFRDALFIVHEADADKLDYSLIKSL